MLFGDAAGRLATLVASLEARPADEAPLESLRAAALTMAAMHQEEHELQKARAKVVTATPLLRARGSERQDDWNDAAIGVLAARGGRGGSPSFDVRLVVGAASAAMRAACQVWVDDPKADLAELVEEGFDQLAAGFRDA